MNPRVQSLYCAALAGLLVWSNAAHAQPPDEPAHIMLPTAPPRAAAKVGAIVPLLDVRPPADPNRPTDPAAQINYDLQAFVLLFNQSIIFPEGTKCIFGGKPGYFGAESWLPESLRLRQLGKYDIRNVQIDHQDANSAQVTVTGQFPLTQAYVPPDLKKFTNTDFQEHLNLRLAPDLFRKSGSQWKLVPPPAPIPEDQAPLHLLSYLAYHLAQTGPQSDELPALTAQENLNLIDAAALRFSLTWNRTFAFNNATALDALVLYLRPYTFFVPGTSIRYSFNDHLSNISVTDIPHRDRTVTFYDGMDDILNYRYGGKAAVAFADEHVDLVTPDQAKNLIWDATQPAR